MDTGKSSKPQSQENSTKEKLLGIDSKFSLKRHSRCVKEKTHVKVQKDNIDAIFTDVTNNKKATLELCRQSIWSDLCSTNTEKHRKHEQQSYNICD